MKSFLLVAFLATSAFAQDFEVGMRHLIVTTGDTGDLELPMSRGFAATAEVFFTPRVSTELSVSFVNPEATYRDVDLGTLGLQTTALTARWNYGFVFVGAGGALVTIGNLDDQLGDEIEVEFDREIAPVVEGGLRVRIGRISGLLLVSYMPLTAEPNVPFPDELSIDPLTVGIGASWRF